MNWLLVFVGGGLGALLRFEITAFVQNRSGVAFPWGTLAVNALGCFAIGVAATWIDESSAAAAPVRAFLLVGLLGGFTTFSAFGAETWHLFEQGRALAAATNAGASLLVCIAAVAAGAALVRAT